MHFVKIIGLTGGIASGKSAVMHLFAQKNVPVIDADEVARAVVQPNSVGLAQIEDHFGSSILTPTGELNRALLREKIFADESERVWLNELLHPLIEAQTHLFFEQHQNAPYLIWAVPLLIETKLYQKVDRILVIDCSAEIQLERLIKRDQISKELALKMIAAQLPQSERLKYADDVIYNHNNLEELQAQVDKLDQFYRKGLFFSQGKY